MSQPHALIVDDSKTAQMRLRKMLERYDLEIDTASSAEEALSYLSYQAPAVVFMDHHMEGMDGLEALRIMKSNPATAMIPVIMYTSEKGDVYVGQARAMGALDIISKEVVKPSSLAKVLSSLNIRPKDDNATNKAAADRVERPAPPEGALGTSPVPPSSELQAVRNQVARLFEIHIADVRQQVADSTKFIVRRLSGDIEDRLAATKNNEVVDLQPPPEPKSDGGGIGLFFSALILLGLLAVAYQVVSISKEQRDLTRGLDRLATLTERQAALLQDINQSASVAATPMPAKARPAGPPVNPAAFLEAIGWAVGVSPQFVFGEPALAEERTGEIAQLLGLLDSARYEGVIFLDLHFGNFCVVRAENGELTLPKASATMADCQLLADLGYDFSVEDQLTLAFASFMQTQPALAQGRLTLELRSRGLRETRYRYPPARPDLSASEWNAAAQLNNRLAFSFGPSVARSM